MKKFLTAAWAKALGVSKTLLGFLLPLLASGTAQVLESLLPVALGIVTELATSDRPGDEKQAIAVSRLRNAAINAGITAGASTLNLAVEMAVAKLKEGAEK
jgi:hypothetical protein